MSTFDTLGSLLETSEEEDMIFNKETTDGQGHTMPPHTKLTKMQVIN